MRLFGATEINYGITDSFYPPAGDNIWLTLEEENVSPMGNRLSASSRQVNRMAKNISSFEDFVLSAFDALNDEITFAKASVFIVASAQQGKPEHMFRVYGHLGPSAHHPYFLPDLCNIKKWTGCVLDATAFTPELCEDIRESVPITITPQVILEVNEENLIEDLEASVRLAEHAYSTLKCIFVNIEHDPEIIDRKTIRFTLTVSGDYETILENEALFKQSLRSNISLDARELITVTYEWEE